MLHSNHTFLRMIPGFLWNPISVFFLIIPEISRIVGCESDLGGARFLFFLPSFASLSGCLAVCRPFALLKAKSHLTRPQIR